MKWCAKAVCERRSLAFATTTEFTFDLACRILLGQCLTFVAFGASLSKGQLDLGPTILEVETQRNQRQTFLPHPGRESAQFASVEKQFARSVGIVRPHAMGELVGGDMHTLEPEFSVREPSVGIDELNVSAAQALDFAALQYDSSFDHVQDGVVVAGFSIAGDHRGAIAGHDRSGYGWSPVPDTLLAVEPSPMSSPVILTPRVHDAMCALALAEYPLEACGLLAGTADTVSAFYPCRNVERSARIYTVDPRDHLRAERSAEELGLEIIGVMHSHTHTEAFPSPTDVEAAPDPSWNYVIVTLKRERPEARAFRIRGDRPEPIVEVPLVIG